MHTTMVSEFTNEECSLCKASREKAEAEEEDRKVEEDKHVRQLKAMEEGQLKEAEDTWKIWMWFNAACRL